MEFAENLEMTHLIGDGESCYLGRYEVLGAKIIM